VSAAALRYVALGDSYTIGTSVAANERFPDQLVAALADDAGPRLDLVANLGIDGSTSAELIRDRLPVLTTLAPAFITVLIGVNDVVRGVAPMTYEADVARILDAVLDLVPPTRVVTISIPDYTLTPAGADYGEPTARRAGIDACNATMARLTRARRVPFVDIGAHARAVRQEPRLVAVDGLHPSGEQYARWVADLVPVVRGMLASGAED
jgi:lysophospholipase L1-like esterase